MAARTLSALVALVVLTAPVRAQDGLRSASLPEHPVTAPPPTQGRDLYRVGPRAFAHVDRRRPPIPPGVYGGGGYAGWPWTPSSYADDPNGPWPAAEPGYLQVLAEPVGAQVYVDGLYIGIVDDLRRTVPGRLLDAGAHRVELRADGYERSALDVRIDPGQTTLMRTALSAVAAAVPRAAPSAATSVARPRVFYVIPGCYAGDKRPRVDRLPGGCRMAALQVIPPVVPQTGGRRPAP